MDGVAAGRLGQSSIFSESVRCLNGQYYCLPGILSHFTAQTGDSVTLSYENAAFIKNNVKDI